MIAKQSSIERQRNKELVIGALQSHQPISRRGIARQTGISYPTVSKIIAEMLRANILDEQDDEYAGRGRPGKVYRLAGESRGLVGLVVGPVHCELVLAGCDGRIHDGSTRRFSTPQLYSTLIQETARHIDELKREHPLELMGLGVTVPGLIDRERQLVVASPNIPQLNGKNLGADLHRSIDLPTTVVQCMHGLFLAERMFGEAGNVDHFVLLNYYGGLGIAVCNDGHLMRGVGGFAGEFGHITVSPNGPVCGCGNRGCLEMFATDKVVAEAVSQRIGRSVNIEEVLAMDALDRGRIDDIFQQAVAYLAIGVATVINIFNPEVVFLHGRFLHMRESLSESLLEQVERRSLSAGLEQCRIVSVRRRPQESERIGAVAAMVHQLTAGQNRTVTHA